MHEMLIIQQSIELYTSVREYTTKYLGGGRDFLNKFVIIHAWCEFFNLHFDYFYFGNVQINQRTLRQHLLLVTWSWGKSQNN